MIVASTSQNYIERMTKLAQMNAVAGSIKDETINNLLGINASKNKEVKANNDLLSDEN